MRAFEIKVPHPPLLFPVATKFFSENQSCAIVLGPHKVANTNPNQAVIFLVDALEKVQSQYRDILRVTIQLTTHLYGVVQVLILSFR